MNKNIIISIVIVLTLVALLWLAGPPEHEALTVETAGQATANPKPWARRFRSQPVLGSSRQEPEEQLLEDFEPQDPGEEAVQGLARNLEEGLIRCPLPAGTPAEVKHPFSFAHQIGNKLIAIVEEPRGEVIIRAPKPSSELLEEDSAAWAAALSASMIPLGNLRWSGAAPGKIGTCTWVEAGTVTISGRVEGRFHTKDGRLSWVNGCASGDSQPLSEQGTFSFQVPRQASCTLELGNAGFGQYGTQIEPLQDLDGIVLMAQPETVGQESLMVAEMKALALLAEADLELFTEGTDSFSEALAEEGLSPDARMLLSSWRANATADAELERAHYWRSAEFFAKARQNKESNDE